MPRPADLPNLTASQARYVLDKLMSERKFTTADVRRVTHTMRDEMEFLERRIAELKGIGEVIKHPVHEAKMQVKTIRRRRRRKQLSAERIASQKMQGQYLGYLRQIPKTARKRFQDLAKTKGREAAIAKMKQKLRK